jgi:small GTP-binding protein
MDPLTNEYDVLVKILLIGDAGVGKTSFCKKLMYDDFNGNYDTTIGIDFFIKYIEYNSKIFKLQIWDTAGQEQFQSLTHSYYRNTDIALIMFDLNSYKESNINKWLHNIDKFCKKDVKKIIIGNKSDLKINVNENFVKKFCLDNNLDYIQISVKENINMDEIMGLVYIHMYKLPDNYFDYKPINFKNMEIDSLIEENNKKNCCTIL